MAVIDLQDSNPIFSLDASSNWIGLQKTHWFRIKDIVETVKFWLYKLTLWPWHSRQNPIFSQDIPAHGGAPQYHVWLQKVAYKHSAEWEQIRVTSVTSGLTTEVWPQLFPFCSKTLHHTQHKGVKRCCRKSADVDSYVRVGRKSMVLAEIIPCARTLHHFKTPPQPPLKKWLIYFVSTLTSSKQH